MNFRELLQSKNVTGYALSKRTGIPYTTINDLINGKTIIQNISLKHAISIADCLNVNVKKLNELQSVSFISFRYFRNNLLIDLKRNGQLELAYKIISTKEIDYYYKNNGIEYALYLLALIDYLFRINNKDIYSLRYNELRREKLDSPFFVGSDIITFSSIEEAEEKLKIHVIPEFKKFNIIEEDIFNVE